MVTSFKDKKVLPYKAQEIYDLVMDIEEYPKFLPWCKKARIVNKISDNKLEADLVVSFKGMYEKYRSEVSHYKSEECYHVKSIETQGPFEKLLSKWCIVEIDDNRSCEIYFDIEFSFKSRILQKMIGFIFEKAAKKMVNSFEARAHDLYKKNS